MRDLEVMRDVLSGAGHQVSVHGHAAPRRIARAISWVMNGGYAWDLTIFTERASKGWMDLSRRNALLPNPEWFVPKQTFQRMDAVLCKTQWTAELMTTMHPRPIFVGFTSRARSQPGITREPYTPLHIAGRSLSKGTGALISAWQRHPDWPVLTVVAWQQGIAIPDEPPANVRVLREFVDDAELRRMQATSGIHLCPSSAEGFGHTLVEGMSAGAVVLTTDAPPMNELVTAQRGVLVPWVSAAPMRAGRCFDVDPAALEAAIATLFSSPPDRLAAIGSAAKTWFEENDAAFRRRLVEVVEALL